MITAEQGITQLGKTGARFIVAESRAMREIVNFVQRVAVSEASSFLIEGENGTGKDLVATTLHDQSPWKADLFSRLTARPYSSWPIGGTLFLDEIDGIAHALQPSYLRVPENRSLRRVGGIHDSIDIRFVAASNVIQIVIPPLRERNADVLPLAQFFIEHYNQKFGRRIVGIEEETRTS